jgi:predicted ATPase/DNA-binding SARP family transcriptional activator
MSPTAVPSAPPATEPATAAAAGFQHTSTDLPVHLTGFIGRRRELDELTRLLESTRLLTLTGAGGSGKTRLAREAATGAASRFSRVAWADLAPLTEAGMVAAAVAAALHVPEHAAFATTDRLVASIGDEPVLLVLDNCEHLVDACAELAECLLRACAGLTVLATSREALGIASETAWLVPRLDEREAMQLFVERAQATVPSFALSDANSTAVREICRRLDGIPLAIELAAARVRVLTPEQIAARLHDAFRLLTAGSRTALARHRTLRGTMDWSYGLLAPREQALLRRLSIFAGGFSLEGAEYVCADCHDGARSVVGAALEPDDVLDGVAALVDKSLVVMEAGESEARYHLLETVRQYSMEHLVAAGELEATRARHARHYLAFMESVSPKLVGGEHEPGLVARIFLDHENLRTAAAWAVADPAHAEEALRFADSLFWYWYGTGNWLRSEQFSELRGYVAHALQTGADAPAILRGRALVAQGLTTLAQGDYPVARESFEAALALLRDIADPYTIVTILAKLGAARMMLGHHEEAKALFVEANEQAATLPLGMVHAFVYFWDTLNAIQAGEIDRAYEIHGHAMALEALMKHRTIRAHQSMLNARIEMRKGNRELAAMALREAIELHLQIGDGWGLTLDLETCAMLLAARARHDSAARLMGAADALRERIGVTIMAIDVAGRQQREATARAALGADYERMYGEGRTLPVEELVKEATQATIAHTAEWRVSALAPPRKGDVLVTVANNVLSLPITGGARLRVRALGPLQTLVDDKPIGPSAWGSARPRELLVYLLMHPEGRTKEHVGLAFWPESSAAQLRNNFHVTIHRLRKALGGSEWITLVNDRYRIDPTLIAEFDAAAFDRDVVAARKALRKGEEGATAALERALALFRGDFLDGEPAGDWHLEHRDRFQRQYIDGLMELGAKHSAQGRASRAAEAYRRVLARDELHEGAVTELMRAHARVGERPQAMRIYQRFAEKLRKELEVEPDDETLDLVEQIQKGKDV